VLTVAADGEIQYDMDDFKFGLHTHANNAEGGLIPVTLHLHEADEATGWTKNGTPQSCPMQDAELPAAVTITHAFATLQTVSGHAAGIAVALNGSALFTIAQNAHVAENKALSIAVAANTDYDITCNENVAGAGADLKITLVGYVTP
jgi:hypothetical protein